MQISTPTSSLTSANSPPEPSLRHIGISIQPDVSAGTDIDQQERLTLAGLQLQEFDSAYVVRPGAMRTALVLEPGQLSASGLLQSLQQIGRRLDLDTALELHGAASALVNAIRDQDDLPSPMVLVLSGPFGEISLDLDRLEPDALRQAFSNRLEVKPSTELQAVHSQLAPLTELVRAGFDAGDTAPDEARNWIQAAKSDIQDPAAFYQLARGSGSPLGNNRFALLIQALRMQSLTSAPTPEEIYLPGAHDSLLASLSDKLLRLIQAADELEAALDLAPHVDGPDIMDLIRSFQEILRQLDHDFSLINKSLAQDEQLADELQTRFAERLGENQRFHQNELTALQGSSKERLRLLVKKALDQAEAEVELAKAASTGH